MFRVWDTEVLARQFAALCEGGTYLGVSVEKVYVWEM